MDFLLITFNLVQSTLFTGNTFLLLLLVLLFSLLYDFQATDELKLTISQALPTSLNMVIYLAESTFHELSQ